MRIIKRLVLLVLASVVAFILVLTVFVRVGRYLNGTHLRSGVVVGIRYDDGHPYETVINLFGKEIRHKHTPKPGYIVEIRNGEKMDFWKVRKDELDQYPIGQYVKR